MSKQEIWYEDRNGELYCIINGQRVYRRTERQHGSSVGSQAPASRREFEYSDPRNPSKYPPIPSGYPPVPSGAASYPPRLQYVEYSELHQRYTSGIPPGGPGGFGDRVSQGSDPSRGAGEYDPYRAALAKLPKQEPPSGTRMAQLYKEYKSADDGAQEAVQAYKARLKKVNVAKSAVKKDKAAFERDGTPRIYNGTPTETREWHQKTAQYAKAAADLFELAYQKRREMGRDFIGYDSKRGGKGHREREDIMRDAALSYISRYEQHLHSHGNPQRQPQVGSSSQQGVSPIQMNQSRSASTGYEDVYDPKTGKTARYRY